MDPLAENHYELSAYAYVLNNPLGYTDPFGLDTLSANTDYIQTYREGVDVVAIDNVTVTAPGHSESRNYGGDGSGSIADKLMYGLDQVNQYLPTTHVLNSITYAFSGKDIMGNSMSLGGATLGAASMLPIGKIGGAAVRGVGNLAAKEGSRVFEVGLYNSLKGAEVGLEAHHVGQRALMKKFIPGYNANNAPSILVPKQGHTLGSGVISRGTSGFSNARQVLARDIMELRRVYPNIPLSSLQQIIQMNKTMYPKTFTK